MNDAAIRPKAARYTALLTAGVYLLVAALWIAWSDKLLLALEPHLDADHITELQTYKGWLFVAVTSLGLYLLLYRSLKRILHLDAAGRVAADRYRELFDSTIDSVLITRSDGRIVGANAAARRMFGYSEAEMACLQRDDLMDAADGRWASALDLRRRSGSVRTELTFIRKDATRFQGEFSSTLFHDERGGEYSSVIVRDVTERKLAEEASRVSEERYRGMFLNNPLPMWIYDIETLKFLAVNESACESYGYSRNEFLAMTIQDIRPEEDQALVQLSVEEDRNVPIARSSWRHRKKNGTMIRVELTSRGLEWNGEKARCVCAVDVTERARLDEAIRDTNRNLEQKVAERSNALAESEARQRSLVEALPQIVWFVNGDGSMKYLNHAWYAFTGRTPRHSLESEWLAALHPDDIEAVQQQWQVAAAHEGKYEGKCRIRAASGRYGNFIYVARPMRSAEGAITHWVGVHTDVTELERTQAALRQSNAELEAFSYTISHDLRAPLRTISGYGQILVEDYTDQLDEGARKTLSRMTRAAAKLSTMIEDLLTLMRLSRTEIQATQVDVSAIAAAIATKLEAAEPSRRVEWRVQKNLVLAGDLGLLRTALENLLANAWKFTGRTDGAVIEVGGERNPAGEIVVHVKDNGAGFDMAYVGKLFGVFQRLHTEAEFAGAGIGLAMVRRIVQRHGGRIWADSKIGEGATFYFTLPNAA
jgi:PAS domain S-box-containing protein